MSTPGSTARRVGLTVMLISASAGMLQFGAGGFGLLLCFVGLLVGANLVGANLVAAGVRVANDGPSPITAIGLVVFTSARPLTGFVRRNTAAVGLVIASCAVTMVSGEADPVLCFATFALLLLGVSLINIGARAK